MTARSVAAADLRGGDVVRFRDGTERIVRLRYRIVDLDRGQMVRVTFQDSSNFDVALDRPVTVLGRRCWQCQEDAPDGHLRGDLRCDRCFAEDKGPAYALGDN